VTTVALLPELPKAGEFRVTGSVTCYFTDYQHEAIDAMTKNPVVVLYHIHGKYREWDIDMASFKAAAARLDELV
jgi:hypothetical protein